MLHLIAFFALLSAVGLPTQGDFRLLMRTDQGIGVLEAGSVTHEGSTSTARLVVGFAADIPDRGKLARWAQYIVTYDCAAPRVRQMAAASFTRSGELVEHDQTPGAWTPVDPQSPHAAARSAICEGAALPRAGGDLSVVLAEYWANPR